MSPGRGVYRLGGGYTQRKSVARGSVQPDRGHRVAAVDATDRVREHVRDRQDRELREHLARGRDRVRDHEPVDRALLDLVRRIAGQARVRACGRDRESAMLLEEGGTLDQRAAARDLVVEHQAVLARDVTDDGNRDGLLVVTDPPLVDHGHGEVEPIGERPGLLGMAGIGRDHDVVGQILSAPVVGHDLDGAELIHGDPEEPLDLRGMEIHGEHAIGSGGRQEVCHEPGRDADARLVLLVRAGVREVRQHGRDPVRRSMLERVDHDEELHDALVDRRRAGLDHEDVALADVLLDLDHEVLVGESHEARIPHGNLEVAADRGREIGVALPPEDFYPMSVHLLLTPSFWVKQKRPPPGRFCSEMCWLDYNGLNALRQEFSANPST